MQPDFTNLVEKTSLKRLLIGFYDAPEIQPFAPVVTPDQDVCVFAASGEKDDRADTLSHPR